MFIQESESVEFKSDYADGIRKDIIAFANTKGGTILIGITDDGEVTGVPLPDQMIQRITNAVRNSIRPDVTMFVHYETEELNGCQVVKVFVNQGTGRPYYLAEKGLQPAGVYVRQGTSAAPASDAAIRQMIRESDGDSYEEMRSLNQELTFSYTEGVFSKLCLDWGTPQMKTLGILSGEGIYTCLGLLLSDQCPHIIKAAAFSGTDQNAFQDRREFSGSLLKQVDDAYAFLDMRNEKSAEFEGLHRVDRQAYPAEALRDALLNAVIHRDYSYSASTLIGCYADRIEIVSVGGLVHGFSMADILMGVSACRNPKLANIFYRLDMVEAYGTGLRKILNAYSGCSAEKLFQTTEKVFKVTLPRITGAEQFREPATAFRYDYARTNEEKVLSLFSDRDLISRLDAEQITGLSSASTVRLLRRLVELRLLGITGNGKNTRYYRRYPDHN